MFKIHTLSLGRPVTSHLGKNAFSFVKHHCYSVSSIWFFLNTHSWVKHISVNLVLFQILAAGELAVSRPIPDCLHSWSPLDSEQNVSCAVTSLPLLPISSGCYSVDTGVHLYGQAQSSSSLWDSSINVSLQECHHQILTLLFQHPHFIRNRQGILTTVNGLFVTSQYFVNSQITSLLSQIMHHYP